MFKVSQKAHSVIRLTNKEISLIKDIQNIYPFALAKDLEEIINVRKMKMLFKLLRIDQGTSANGKENRTYNHQKIIFNKKIRNLN